MLKYFILIFLTSVFYKVEAVETLIAGKIPGGENYEIRLSIFSDLVTYSEEIVDRDIVDTKGNFSFSIDIKETLVSKIDIEFYSASIYLEPGGEYKIVFDSVSINDQYRPFYNKEELLTTKFIEPEPGLNQMISEFNMFYNNFILENFENIYKKRKKSLIDSFNQEVSTKYDTINNEYFQNYIEYKIASIELAPSSVNKSELFKKYIINKPVLYKNVEYMYFFNGFFAQYLTAQTRFISRADLNSAINYQKSYPALMDTIGKDTLLRNEVIRELVMLKGLNDLYFGSDYWGPYIIDILDQVAESSKFPEHRLIAANIKKALTKLTKGTKAPDFELLSLVGDSIALSDFIGKPVYLSFLTTWSYACLAEFKLMENLFNDYRNKIDFITISLDKKIETITRFKNEKGYNWTFLHNGTQYDLIKDYNIKTFPMFVLIDGEGNIYQYPAYKPSEIIEKYFKEVVNKNSK